MLGRASAPVSIAAYTRGLSVPAHPSEDFAGLVSALVVSVIAFSSRHILRDFLGTDTRPTTAATSTPQRIITSTPTLLIFRDKHTQEVQNYAIVGGTLWIFSEQKATKLPLSWLDIEATTKANEDRGVDFQLPK